MAPLKCFNEREMPKMDLRRRLGNIMVPTLIIVGRYDFITTLEMAEDIIGTYSRGPADGL